MGWEVMIVTASAFVISGLYQQNSNTFVIPMKWWAVLFHFTAEGSYILSINAKILLLLLFWTKKNYQFPFVIQLHESLILKNISGVFTKQQTLYIFTMLISDSIYKIEAETSHFTGCPKKVYTHHQMEITDMFLPNENKHAIVLNHNVML